MIGRLELLGAVALLAATLLYAVEPDRVVISGDDVVPIRLARPQVTVPTSVSTLSYAGSSGHMMPVYTPCQSTSTVTASSTSGTLCTTMVPVSR